VILCLVMEFLEVRVMDGLGLLKLSRLVLGDGGAKIAEAALGPESSALLPRQSQNFQHPVSFPVTGRSAGSRLSFGEYRRSRRAGLFGPHHRSRGGSSSTPTKTKKEQSWPMRR